MITKIVLIKKVNTENKYSLLINKIRENIIDNKGILLETINKFKATNDIIIFKYMS